jgi:hypothetical protein
MGLFAVEHPHGVGDAIAIWNLRARFLFRGWDGAWRAGFSADLAGSNPDYPLLIPAALRRLWAYAGGETVAGPMLFAASFWAAGLLILGATVSVARGVVTGCIAALVLLATGYWHWVAGAQYADVPLACALTGAVAVLVLAERGAVQHDRAVVLAGLLCGFAGWTKNEGMLAALAVSAGWLWSSLRRGGWRRTATDAGLLLAGIAMPAACLAVFKTQLAAPSYLFAHPAAATARDRLLDASRYWTILRAFPAHVYGLGPGAALLPVVAVVLGFSASRFARSWITAALGLLVCGEVLVFAVTPLPLEWQLATALRRLIVQLWPTAVLAVLLAAGEARRGAPAPASDASAAAGSGPGTAPGRGGSACAR